MIEGAAVTVMAIDGPPLLVQLESLTLTTLSVVAVVTLMVRDEFDVLTVWVRLSDHCTVHGPLPVSENGTVSVAGPQDARLAGTMIVGPEVMATSADDDAAQLLADVTVTARCTLPLLPAV
jgi:hypothetical protein